MTQKKTITVNCPACFEDSSFEIYTAIDAKSSPELKEKIFNRDIFKFSCRECGEEILVAYDCTYTDEENKYIVALLSDEKENSDSNMTVDGYTLRIVRSINEFVEKLALIEDGIDDKVTELYKIMLEDQFEDERPGSKILGIYYGGKNPDDNSLLFFIITENAENCRATLSPETYNAIANQFKATAEKYNDISEVNRLWAIGALQSGFENN
ncbi:MAG: CpXC domain-containing protein [Clostridia bacterium]|nr:CpXC domain-containing protein [Clostridia bacterium]